jgi:hypothetical protein
MRSSATKDAMRMTYRRIKYPVAIAAAAVGLAGAAATMVTPAPAHAAPPPTFGGFGPTLPSCHYETRWVVCGSPLPGYPAPRCLEWVYSCRFPG